MLMKKINKTLSTAILICCSSLAVFAQTGEPVEWKPLKMIEPDCKTFAVSLPIPPKNYSLKSFIVSREQTDTGKGFYSTVGDVSFNATFETGINAAIFNLYQKEFADFKKSDVARSKISGIKFSKESETHEFFLVGDVLHHLWTTGANESNALAKQFLDSLKFDRLAISPDICASDARPDGGSGSGNGSREKFVLPKVSGTGKKIETEISPPATPKTSDGTAPLKIISKPLPEYTALARDNNISGIVQLKIVFKSDGSIGDIGVVSGLPDGLTEKAIAAARKIAFVPASENGKPISVTKTVEFVFNLY